MLIQYQEEKVNNRKYNLRSNKAKKNLAINYNQLKKAVYVDVMIDKRI